MKLSDLMVLGVLLIIVILVVWTLYRQNKRAKTEGRCAFCSQRNSCTSHSCEKKENKKGDTK